MMIDCDACAARGPACGDCVVTVLLGAPPADEPLTGLDGGPDPGFDLDRREQAAIAVLAGSGLIPPLRLVPVDRTSDVARPADPDADPGVADRTAERGSAGRRRTGTDAPSGYRGRSEGPNGEGRDGERPGGPGRAAV